MKVLVAVNEARRSGAPLSALGMLRLIDRRRASVTVVVKRDGPLVEDFRRLSDDLVVQPGGTRYAVTVAATFRGFPTGGNADRRRADEILRQHRPSVVVAETVVAADFVGAARNRSVPTMLIVREPPGHIRRFVGLYGGPDACAPDVLVVNSEATGAAARAVLGREPDVVVYPPVGRVPDLAAVRREPWVTSIGSMNRTKGFDTASDVADAWVSSGPRELRFRWVGCSRRSVRPSRSQLRCLPPVADVFPLLAGSVMSFIPSRTEPLGRVAVESLLVSTPVVASRVGGLPEAVGPGGVWVPPGDVGGFTEAILDLWDSPRRRAELAEAGHEHVRRRFAPEAYRRSMSEALSRMGVPVDPSPEHWS